MSTQQNNAEVADGHSFADKIGQLVSAKYQALFGTTTYSKRRVMSGVVMTRYVSYYQFGCGISKMMGPKKQDFCNVVTRFQGFHLIF